LEAAEPLAAGDPGAEVAAVAERLGAGGRLTLRRAPRARPLIKQYDGLANFRTTQRILQRSVVKIGGAASCSPVRRKVRRPAEDYCVAAKDRRRVAKFAAAP